MDINTKPSNTKKKVTVCIIAALVVAALMTAAAAYAKIGPFAGGNAQKDTTKAATEEQIDAGKAAKQSTVENGGKGTNTGSDPLPSPSPASDPNGKSTVGADITSANQDGSVLRIRALVQTVTSSGNCSLSMSGPNGKTYSANASVQAIASSTTCQGFDVPIASLSSGDWDITVTFTNGSLTASASKTVTIQ